MKRLLLLLCLCIPAFAASTAITDSVYLADDTTAPIGSYIVISWPRFTTPAGHSVPAGKKTVNLAADGSFTVSLEPTDVSIPAFVYTAEYHVVDAAAPVAHQFIPTFSEYWSVPTSASPKIIQQLVSSGIVPIIGQVRLVAKGDTVAFDGANPVRVPVGADGTVLTADSTQTSGVSYKSIPPAGLLPPPSAGVVTGTVGSTTTGALPLNAANGVPQLDSNARIPGTQLGNGDVDSAHLSTIKNVTSDVQAQINTNAANIATNTTAVAGKLQSPGAAGVVQATGTGNATSVLPINSANGLPKLDGNGALLPAVFPAFTGGDAHTVAGSVSIAIDRVGGQTAAAVASATTAVASKLQSPGAAGVVQATGTGNASAVLPLNAANGLPQLDGSGHLNVTAGYSTSGTVNFASATATSPLQSGLTASKPATCTIGQMYYATDAAAGQNIYGCTATNTWTQQGGSGGSSTTTTEASRTVTASTTALTTDSMIYCDATTAAVTITLPNSSNGRLFKVKKIDTSANNCNVTPASGQIEFITSVALSSQGATAKAGTDGTNWYLQ